MERYLSLIHISSGCDILSQPPCCHRRDKESAVYRPHSALRNLRCPKGGSVSLPHHAFKGVALNYPLLLWDGVALSYPTDATMEPLSIRWTPGRPIGWPGSEFRTPVDLLRVVHILDNFPRALSCYKMPRRRSCPVPYAHRCTVFSYSSIGRDSGISGFRTGATGSVYCRQFRQYGQLPRW